MKHTALQFPPFKGGLGKVLLLLLLFLPMLLHAQENAYLDAIRIDNYQLQKNGKEVQLDMTLHFDNLQLDAQHALRLVPILASADGTHQQPLEAIQLYGTQRQKVQQRANVLSGTPLAAPGDRLHTYRKNGETAPMTYRITLPYERWMLDSNLNLEAQVVGCAQCNEGNETLYLAQHLLPAPKWTPLMVDALPLPVEQKQRYEPHYAYIQFAQSKHDIRPSLANNAAQLDSVFIRLQNVLSDEKLTLTSIEVDGYVSPEGGAVYNQRLSERRAGSFVDYVSARVPAVNRNMFHAEGRGEAWNHLQAMLQEKPLEPAADIDALVQQAIDQPGQQDAIDRQLRNLPIGRTLLEEYYPQLRCIIYTLHYDVRPFTVEEGRRLIDTHPHLFSANELQQVADSYLPDTLLYIAALQKAVKTYPEQTALAYNLALAQYKANQPQQALQTLQATQPTAPVCNLRGIAHMQLKQYPQALDAFRQAIDLGSAEASSNLAQAQEVISYE